MTSPGCTCEGSPDPGNAALGVVDDVALTEAVARSIGVELFAAGVDLNTAPVVDVNSNPANPVIGVRSFGADPSLVKPAYSDPPVCNQQGGFL